MQLWRLSSARHARDLDGGFGLVSSGRWNSVGYPVTYCSTVASLCALEKRVHYQRTALLPPQLLVEYAVPDELVESEICIGELPADWNRREALTRGLGDAWLDRRTGALLIVPSVIVPITAAPGRNVLINHRHTGASGVRIVDVMPFTLDPRLFAP